MNRGRGLTILLYHSVQQRADPLRPGDFDAAAFDAQMRVLSWLYTPLGLHEALQLRNEGELPRRAVCVTFDDGYADNYSVALPIMRRHKVPMTLFVATGFLDGGRMWNDTVIETLRLAPPGDFDLRELGLDCYAIGDDASRELATRQIIAALKYLPMAERQQRVEAVAALVAQPLPVDLMLRCEQVNEMAQSDVEIGGHTVNHPILCAVDAGEAREEIRRGKERLESITGRPVRYFAYPNGRPGQDYDEQHAAMVEELGFDAAVSTESGTAYGASDRFQLPRFAPWAESGWRFGLRLAHQRLH